MCVGCHDHPCGFHVEGSLIVALCEIGVVEMAMEQGADEFGCRPPAAAMDHLNRAVEARAAVACKAGGEERHVAASSKVPCWRKRP